MKNKLGASPLYNQMTVCQQVQITAVDELYVEQDAEGSVLKQIARVRLFFLGFLSGNQMSLINVRLCKVALSKSLHFSCPRR